MARWRCVTGLTSLGNPFEYQEPVLPRIPDELMDSVVYLYPTTEYAEQGKRTGGTGFLVSVPAVTVGAPATVYAVTNRHVIDSGCPVVRLNNVRDEREVVPLERRQWVPHPGGDDIAVCPIGLQPEHRFYALDRTEWLLAEGDIAGMTIGPGDEVFFLGRYISHQGSQRNLPTARFGTISMLPFEKISDTRGNLVDAFLIEARSLSGYSGSPVFLYIRPYTLDMEMPGPVFRMREPRPPVLRLLGIDLGHHATFRPVVDDKRKPVNPPRQVEQNSGMMCVSPAWKLNELLDRPELAEMRHEGEREWVEEHGEPVH